jgi:hypothetical protein
MTTSEQKKGNANEPRRLAIDTYVTGFREKRDAKQPSVFLSLLPLPLPLPPLC